MGKSRHYSLLLVGHLSHRLVCLHHQLDITMKVAIFALFVLVCVEGKKGPKVTHKAWFEIAIDGENVGKIEIGLFGKTVPKTVENFVQLSQKDEGEGYKGSIFLPATRLPSCGTSGAPTASRRSPATRVTLTP